MSIEDVVAIILGAVLTTLVGLLFKWTLKWRKQEIIFRYAIRKLIKNDIARTVRECYPTGEISTIELDRALDLYGDGKKLDINGLTDANIKLLESLARNDFDDTDAQIHSTSILNLDEVTALRALIAQSDEDNDNERRKEKP